MLFDVFDTFGRDWDNQALNYTPVGLEATETGWKFEMDMPGVLQDDLRVEVVDDMLVVEGCRTGKEKTYKRRMVLNGLVDIDKISAKLENGVLYLELPKTKAALPQKIKVI
jgi:HSP20 family molecular chaperone IbpA